MNSRKSRTNNKTRSSTSKNALVSLEKQTLTAIRDLTTVTRDYGLPRRKDITPPTIPDRGKVHRFVRSAFYNVLTSTSGITLGSGNFKLSDLPNYTDFTALFDKYRFVCVIAKFIPTTQKSEVGSATSLIGDNPLVYTVIDYDDASAPLSIDELRQFDTAQVNQIGTYFERAIVPRAALGSYSGTFASYSQAPQNMWHDCNSPNIQFYGLKWATTAFSTSGTTALYQIEVDYIMEFANPR